MDVEDAKELEGCTWLDDRTAISDSADGVECAIEDTVLEDSMMFETVLDATREDDSELVRVVEFDETELSVLVLSTELVCRAGIDEIAELEGTA